MDVDVDMDFVLGLFDTREDTPPRPATVQHLVGGAANGTLTIHQPCATPQNGTAPEANHQWTWQSAMPIGMQQRLVVK